MKINELELSEFLPPVRQLGDHNIVGDKAELDLFLGCGLPDMGAPVLIDRVASVAGLVLCRCQDLMGQGQDVETLALVRRS